jgi:hypothetical protein
VIRSLVVRNAISALLFVVAVVGVFVQIRNVHQGLVGPETRLAAIVVRSRGMGKTDR